MNSRWINFDNEERMTFRYEGWIEKDRIFVDFTFVEDALIIYVNKNPVLIRAKNFAQEQMLNKIRQFQDRTLIKIQRVETGYVHLGIFIFNRRLFFTAENPLTFSIPEQFKIKNRGKIPEKDLLKFMRSTFILKGDTCFFRYSRSSNNPDELSGTLFGEAFSCEVTYNADLQQINTINLNPRKLGDNIYGAIVLINGAIDFTDGISQLKESAIKIYQDESAEQKEFEKIWLAYNDAMIELAREETNRIGYRRYSGVSYNPLRLKIDTSFTTYSDGDFLTSTLGYAVCNFDQFNAAKAEVAGEESEKADFSKIVHKIKGSIFIGDNLEKNSSRNEYQSNFEVKRGIPNEGYIFAPLAGSQVMHDRRRDAYNIINRFRNPLPTLKTIITGGKTVVQNVSRPHKAVNFALSKKVFGKRDQLFTERQKEAIDVAINTPDIAIIQGPPGTGKTTVIKAIVERLNDIYKDSKLKILIASTQHDAVDNAIEKMECGGLPPYRLGGKQNSGSQNFYYLQEWFNQVDEVCIKFLENDSDSQSRSAIRKIYSLIEMLQAVDVVNDFQRCQELLGELYCELQTLNFPAETLNEIETVARRLIDTRTENDNDNEDLFLKKLLDMQRTEPISFSDDGNRNLRQLKMYLEMNVQTDFEIPAIWNELLDFKAGEDIPAELMNDFEDSLRGVREKFFGKPITDNVALRQKDLRDMITLVKSAVDSYGQTFVRSIYDVIREFREKLQSSEGIINLMAKYTKIIAATCQQSKINNFYLDEKNKRVYDYVIIDEAARSNPLDLLIPMSVGRFIILVGDQKQLPPMLEDDVVEKILGDKNLSKDELSSKRQLLEEPLFQRLYNSLLVNLDAKRVVMLRDQYRMHPVIGKFVSDNFYEGQLRSPLPAELKSHNLGLYNNSAVAWINVGKNFGLEESIRYGKVRKAEVDCVVEEVEKILSLNKNYTVGVITFYKLQEENLRKNFADMPFQQKIRLQVGTVDAFQGKEFDVVILSTVRCNENKNLRARTGFVSSMNRLCVTFSRAKRLLIVVGDCETIARQNGVEYVKPFANFYDLCLKDGYFGEYENN